MESALVNKIIPFSSVDGPGNRSAVFLQGCGFACKYCHNPETINVCSGCGKCVAFCKTGALACLDGKVIWSSEKCVSCDECIHHCDRLSSPKARRLSTDDVMSVVKKNIPFIRGITVSGGECTGQRDFLYELCSKAKEEGLNVCVDTNGSYLFEDDKQLLSVVDGVFLDIKAWNEEEHFALTSALNESVKKNLFFLLKEDKLREVRTVVVPSLIDALETIKNVASILVKAGHPDVKYKIIKYRPFGVRNEFKDIEIPTEDFLNKLKAYAEEIGLTNVSIT